MYALRYFRKLVLLIGSKFNTLSILITGLSLVFSFSFAFFLVVTDKYKASEMYIGNLSYLMNINVIENPAAVSGASVTIPDQYTYTTMINITSINPVRSKYKLQYNTSCATCEIFVSDVTSWNTSGSIAENYANSGMTGLASQLDTKTIKVIIINTSGSSATVNFGVTGGYNYNNITSVALLDGYNENFKTNYVDSSSSKILIDIVKDDTECVPTETTPCYYGGEEKRNYITNNDKIYRLLGVYLISGVEYVKMIQIGNESQSSYDNLTTTLQTYNNSLPSNKLDYLTGDISIISHDEYSKIGGIDSYLNNGTIMLTNTLLNTQVYQVNTSGEVELILTTVESGIRPVLTLKTTARVKIKGDGSIADPYVIYEALSDVVIDNLTIDGTPASSVPETGVYDLSSTCTGGTAEWIDRTNMIKFNLTESPVSCSLAFTNKDMKLNITVDGVTSSIPTTGNYNMEYKCYKGSATLTWDNTDYSLSVTNLSSPLLCDVKFTTAT